MKVLVVGNGGREHAIAWKLLQSPRVKEVICTPGNGGTATLVGCQNMPVAVDDLDAITRIAVEHQVDLVVVGPELPLSLGITDMLQKHNIKVFGPNQMGAEIEASKAWAKTLMNEAKMPTAKSMTFTELEPAVAYVIATGAPIVIKADGLAAGKGVIVAMTLEDATDGVKNLFDQGFSKLVIEEFLTGEEVSILALTDGETIRPLLPAQDHKRIGEGDTGKNTGGMGAYCPAPIVTEALQKRIDQEVLQPTLAALKQRGIDYCGVLYAGLMITPEGEPKVLEFNCRFGDPETQAILPLLVTPLDELLLACVEKRLHEIPPLQWHQGGSVCVVVASGGYPGDYAKGKAISGISEAQQTIAVVFQAGTKLEQETIFTDGGRVLGVTAVGKNFPEAIARVYQGVDLIQFEGIYYRRDIAHRVTGKQ